MIVAAPHEVNVAWRIDAVITDDGHADETGQFHHVAVQRLGKRVSGIYQQAYVMSVAERFHLSHIHSASEPDAMRQLNVLKFATGGIEVGGP